MMFGGIPIYSSVNALKASSERLFPESRHRSRRVRKKLIKRYGSEFRMVPCIWDTPAGFVAHPSMYAELRARIGAIR